MRDFFEQLKERNVYRVAMAYAVTGWLIIQVVDTLDNNLGWPNSIPSLITRVILAGFPIALVLAWLYEISPRGLIRTGTIQKASVENDKMGRLLNRIIIGVLALALSFLLVERFFYADKITINREQEASIAVLSFDFMSGDREMSYIADGLRIEIEDRLRGLKELFLVSGLAKGDLEDKSYTLKELANYLDVNYLLKGSVFIERNRISLNVSLINASTGYTRWYREYEGEIEEILKFQDEIAQSVLNNLRIQIVEDRNSSPTENHTENIEAYKYYVRAVLLGHKRDQASIREAIRLLEEALDRDPTYGKAHAELVIQHLNLYVYGNIDRSELLRLISSHVEAAISMNPESPQTLRAQARLIEFREGDLSHGINLLEKAISLQPNYPEAYWDLGRFYREKGQTNQSLEAFQRSIELDPSNYFYTSQIARRLFFIEEEFDKAMDIINRYLTLDTLHPAAYIKSEFLMSPPNGKLSESFLLTHALYNKYPNQLRGLNQVLIRSILLGISPLAQKYSTLMQIKYPDNEFGYFWVLMHFASEKQYDLVREHILTWSRDKGLSPEKSGLDLAIYNMTIGKTQEAIQIFESTFPDFINEGFRASNLTREKAAIGWYYVEVLRMNGEEAKAKPIAEELTAFYNKTLQNDSSLRFDTRYQLNLESLYTGNDTLGFINALENTYFEKKMKGVISRDIQTGAYRRFRNIPEYQNVIERITSDIKEQRAEVIAALKKSGDWEPAWDLQVSAD